MPRLIDFRLTLGNRSFLPLMSGGMGVDISTAALALSLAKMGAIGHISDAMSPYVSDRRFGTRFQSEKQKKYKHLQATTSGTTEAKWDYDSVYKASFNHVRATMDAKKGQGGIFINVMEKLSMGNPAETLRARLNGALDAGVDGITLSAGLHTGTLRLIENASRFRDAFIGIIVSSARALKIFLRSAARVNRLPDYVIVEGPLAGGHLGFGEDWRSYELKNIVDEVLNFLREEGLSIPVIPAGGVFTGTDATEYLTKGAGAVQVATRFTISEECGLPPDVKQRYLRAREEDVVVNSLSPTGYPMRMLRGSPCATSNIKPNCEALGYILDGSGHCSYRDAYTAAGFNDKGEKLPVTEKMCICYHFMKFSCYTCGHYVYRLKDTTVKLPNGAYLLPSAEHIALDYLLSQNHEVSLPSLPGEELTEENCLRVAVA